MRLSSVRFATHRLFERQQQDDPPLSTLYPAADAAIAAQSEGAVLHDNSVKEHKKTVSSEGANPEERIYLPDPGCDPCEDYKQSRGNVAPRAAEIGSHLLESNVVEGRRSRKPSAKLLVSLRIAKAFAAALQAPTIGTTDNPNLPLEPISIKKARLHIHKDSWIAAEEEEYKAYKAKGTWRLEKPPPGQFPLPTKIVYQYKYGA